MKSKILFGLLFFAVACAPKTEERLYPSHSIDIGPRFGDTFIDTEKSPYSKPQARVPILWNDQVQSAQYFLLINDLYLWAKENNRPAIASLGGKLLTQFYAQANSVNPIRFSESPYISAAIGETQEEAHRDLGEGIEMLKQNEDKLLRLILASKTEFPWPNGGEKTFVAEAQTFKAYIDWLLQKLSTAELDPRVEKGFFKKVQQRLHGLISMLPGQALKIDTTPEFKVILSSVRELATEAQIQLEPGQLQLLAFGERMNQLIEAVKTEQNILTILVEIWEHLSPEERETDFRKRIPELHDFLVKEGQDNRDCLKQDACTGLFIGFAKKKIFKEIKKLGIVKVRDEIFIALLETARTTSREAFAKVVKGLPDIFKQEVIVGLSDYRRFLKNIDSDFSGFVRRAGYRWGARYLGSNQQLGTFEVDSFQIDWSRNNIHYLMVPRATNGEVASKTIATSIIGNMSHWSLQKPSPELGKVVLEQINKLLVLGGYRQESGEFFPSFALAMDDVDPARSRLNLRQIAASPFSFYVPEKTFLKSGYLRRDNIYDQEVTASTQAELLRSYSAMIRYFRDWEQNSYDETLGKIKISELITEFQSLELEKNLFPKDTMFSLAIGNASALLLNLTRKLSPLFLQDVDGEVKWGHQYSFEDETPVVLAGVVGLHGLQHSEKVLTQDVCKWIAALTEFYEATEGMENSKAKALLSKNDKGETVLESILKSRKKLKMLIVGLGNFLSSRLRDANGMVISSYSLSASQGVSDGVYHLSDQVAALQALTTLRTHFNVRFYGTAILEIYYALNREFYRQDLGFYSSASWGTQLPTLPVMVKTLRTLEGLKVHLTDNSREQLEKIVGPWVIGLENFSK